MEGAFGSAIATDILPRKGAKGEVLVFISNR